MAKGKFSGKSAEQPAEETKAVKTETVSGGRKVWEIVKQVITWIVLVAAVAMMIFTIVSVSTFNRNDRDLFGYKAFIVQSDSMKATDFDAGDLVLVKEVDPATLQVGDIIAFRSLDDTHYGETVTHKIRSLTVDDMGNPAFVTYGTTTDVDDATPVTYDRVYGKYQVALPSVGAFFAFLKTVPGYICCILIPFLLLIVMQGINSIRLFRQYKQEQMAELDAKRQKEMDEMAAEREKLAAEREESKKMLEELQRLQAQLQQQAAQEEE